MPGQPNGALDDLAARLAEFVTWRAWLVIAATLLAVLAAGASTQFLGFSNDYRIYFGPRNPELLAFEAFQDTYTTANRARACLPKIAPM